MLTFPQSNDDKLAELLSKISIEQKVFEGASQMLQKLSDKNARDQCEMNVIESRRRLEFLESEYAKLTVVQSPKHGQSDSAPPAPLPKTNFASMEHLHFKQSSVSSEQSSWRNKSMESLAAPGTKTSRLNSFISNIKGSIHSLRPSHIGSPLDSLTPQRDARGSITSLNTIDDGPLTGFNALKFNSALTSEKIKYRLEFCKEKLELETKYLYGIENMLLAMSADPGDKKALAELENKIKDTKAKIGYLKKSVAKYEGLYVVDIENTEEEKIGKSL